LLAAATRIADAAAAAGEGERRESEPKHALYLHTDLWLLFIFI
jgi:hypothetical protein